MKKYLLYLLIVGLTIGYGETSAKGKKLVRESNASGGEDEISLLPTPKQWKIKFDKKEVGEKEGWQKKDYNDSSWDRIKVPAFWHGPCTGYAWYRTSTYIPQELEGFEIYLHFGSVDEYAWVYINGKFAGAHATGDPAKAWKEPFSVRIDNFLKYGRRNIIAVKVFNKVGAGGIYKPVHFVVLKEPSALKVKKRAAEKKEIILIPVPEQWKIKFDKKEVGEKEGWQKKDYNDSSWDRIKVPAFWDNTYGVQTGYAWYRASIYTPHELEGFKIYLHFGSVDEYAWVYINGELAGTHATGDPGRTMKEPFRMRIDNLLKYGRGNIIAVKVHNKAHSGGIYKPVHFVVLKEPGALKKKAVKDFSPKQEEQQLPMTMHSAMKELPRITVGKKNADLIGNDNRILQAAVDYIAGLGGGVVEIDEGEYIMYDSLHLRSNVTVRGKKGKTILRKADGVVSALALDGDLGEQQITVEYADGLAVGYGVAVWDDLSPGFHTTVAIITGRRENTFSIDRPLVSNYMVHNKAKLATVFPVVSAYHTEGARIENLTIDGNKGANFYLNGCRGAGIYLYRAFGIVIQGCVVRNYNGDGISFQQSNDVTVVDCICEDNMTFGIHPGSGSQRPIVRKCIARRNRKVGLFFCWRVRHGLFEDNILEENGLFGISIGHKDSDNLLRRNVVRLNRHHGIFFRSKSLGMAAHRNRLEENIIENNGTGGKGAGIYIQGQTNNLVFKNNIIRDTRAKGLKTQTVGIHIGKQVGIVILDGNKIEAKIRIDDQRATKQSTRLK